MDFYQLVVPDEPIDPLDLEFSKAEIEDPFPNWTSWIFFPRLVLVPQAMASSIKWPFLPKGKRVIRHKSSI